MLMSTMQKCKEEALGLLVAGGTPHDVGLRQQSIACTTGGISSTPLLFLAYSQSQDGQAVQAETYNSSLRRYACT